MLESIIIYIYKVFQLRNADDSYNCVNSSDFFKNKLVFSLNCKTVVKFDNIWRIW